MVEERRLQGRDQPFQRITRQGGLGKKVKIAENVRLIGTSNGKQVGIKVAVRRGMGGRQIGSFGDAQCFSWLLCINLNVERLYLRSGVNNIR